MPLFILAGYTGSGKTQVLTELQRLGQQVIQLEALAAHNGSVFGHLPHSSAPSSYALNKALLRQWKSLDLSKSIFCENKAPTLGRLSIPAWLFRLMEQAPAIWLEVNPEIRLQRIVSLYGNADPLAFYEALSKLAKRLSEQQIDALADFYARGQRNEAFRVLMDYYDQGFYYQKTQRPIIAEIEVEHWDAGSLAKSVLHLSEKHLKVSIE